MNKSDNVEVRIGGSRRSHIARDLFSNSMHFPVANLFYEMLLEGPGEFIFKVDIYILALAAIVQAYFIGSWNFKGRPRPFLGNLIGPATYSIAEMLLEGPAILASPNHMAYWGFSVLIGGLQALRGARPWRIFIIMENVSRAMILFVMYWFFEAAASNEYIGLAEFFKDSSHTYIFLAIIFSGLMLGLSDIAASRYLILLKETASRLKQFSSWFLGANLLSEAVENPESLSLSRKNRSIFFMDIRGFTAWSEGQNPEEVVAMLNGFYEAVEGAAHEAGAIKAKFTADEVLLFFASAEASVRAALLSRRAAEDYLRPFGLAAGAAVHYGPVVEGLLGTSTHKAFDIIGDAANVASRLCGKAQGGEVIISEQLLSEVSHVAEAGNRREIAVKGKEAPLVAYTLTGIKS